jgi:hypothetical protein
MLALLVSKKSMMTDADDDDEVQDELATQQPHPMFNNSAPEDKGTPEAELVDDKDLGNSEEEAASAMDVEAEILNEEKEELEDQDAEQEDDSTVDPEEKKQPPTEKITEEEHKAEALP